MQNETARNPGGEGTENTRRMRKREIRDAGKSEGLGSLEENAIVLFGARKKKRTQKFKEQLGVILKSYSAVHVRYYREWESYINVRGLGKKEEKTGQRKERRKGRDSAFDSRRVSQKFRKNGRKKVERLRRGGIAKPCAKKNRLELAELHDGNLSGKRKEEIGRKRIEGKEKVGDEIE